MKNANGTFDVKLIPQGAEDRVEGNSLGRNLLEKKFHGDLEGTSKGEMLTAMSPVKGSGTYVAVERFSGKLHGRDGTFMLHHLGTMTRGSPSLAVTVVPDSGTGALTGLMGKMAITVTPEKHTYDFEYTLEDRK
jgi:hypothetical protein